MAKLDIPTGGACFTYLCYFIFISSLDVAGLIGRWGYGVMCVVPVWRVLLAGWFWVSRSQVYVRRRVKEGTRESGEV